MYQSYSCLFYSDRLCDFLTHAAVVEVTQTLSIIQQESTQHNRKILIGHLLRGLRDRQNGFAPNELDGAMV